MKRIKILSIVGCLVMCCFIILRILKQSLDVPNLDAPIIIPADDNSIMNATRSNSRPVVWMGVYNHELYFCPFKGRYKGWLCRFDTEGGIHKVYKLDASLIFFGIADSILYFTPWEGEVVCCGYDFIENSVYEIYSGDSGPINIQLPWLIKENSVYIALGYGYGDEKTYEYIHIIGKDIVEITTTIDGEMIRNLPFYKTIELQSGSKLTHHERAILSTEYGTIVHNQHQGDMLYLIDTEGTIVQLFDVQCIDHESAITVLNDSVYLSFLRYEDVSEDLKGLKRFENDSMEGTYRISLVNYGVEKLNDTIYDGLYAFGDGYIYACDDTGSIFRLNADGTVKDVLWNNK